MDICPPLCPSVYSACKGGLAPETIETLLAGTIPTERHHNHSRLFSLARVKAFELGRPMPLNEAELRAVFFLWHERAVGFWANYAWFW